MCYKYKVNKLMDYKNKLYKLKSLQEQKRGMIDIISSAKAIKYSDMPKGNKKTDLSDLMVQLEELNNKILNAEAECIKEKVIIENAITNMTDGVGSIILRMKYIQFKSMEDIGKKLGYSRSKIYRDFEELHKNAINQINFDFVKLG